MSLKSEIHPQYWLLFLGLMLAVGIAVILVAQPAPYLALLVPLIIPILLILLYRPEYGYYLILAIVPLDSLQVIADGYPPFISIAKFIGIIVILALSIRFLQKPKSIQRLGTPIWYPLLGLFIVAIISTLFTNFLMDSLDNLRRLATAYIFTAMTIFFIRENQLKKTVPIVLITSISISSFWATLGNIFHFLGFSTVAKRAVGGTTDPNYFAAIILISLPLIAHYLFKAKSGKYKLFFLVLFIHNTYSIIVTYSRAGILVLAVILVVLLIEHLKKIKAHHLGVIIIIATIIMIGYKGKISEMYLWERMGSLTSPSAETSLSRRASYLKVAWETIKDNPIIGIGPGTFPLIYGNSNYAIAFAKHESDYVRRAHNTYIEVIVGTGGVGFLLFCSTLFLSFRYFYKSNKLFQNIKNIDDSLIRAYLYSFLSFCFSIVFISSLYHEYIWMFIGLSVVVANISGKKNETIVRMQTGA